LRPSPPKKRLLTAGKFYNPEADGGGKCVNNVLLYSWMQEGFPVIVVDTKILLENRFQITEPKGKQHFICTLF
jgi:hypothetical protein